MVVVVWWGGGTSSELANVTSSQPGCGSYVIKGKLGLKKKKKVLVYANAGSKIPNGPEYKNLISKIKKKIGH